MLGEDRQFLKTFRKVLFLGKKKYFVLRIRFESYWHRCGTVHCSAVALKISERTSSCNVKAYLIFFSNSEYCNITTVCPNGTILATPLKKHICPACEILCNSKEKCHVCFMADHLFYASLVFC